MWLNENDEPQKYVQRLRVLQRFDILHARAFSSIGSLFGVAGWKKG